VLPCISWVSFKRVIAPLAVLIPTVDAHSSSGQNLFKQYASKKTKVILDHRWAKDCVKASRLLLFADNFGGCKVSGDET